MAWNKSLAFAYAASLAEWRRDAKGELLSEAYAFEVERLDDISEEDVAHPSVFRAFLRGACDDDPIGDTLFLAVCYGDRSLYDDLYNKRQKMRQRMRQMPKDYGAGREWVAAQDAFLASSAAIAAKQVANEPPCPYEVRMSESDLQMLAGLRMLAECARSGKPLEFQQYLAAADPATILKILGMIDVK
jgi:hypothetical protein